MADIHSEQLARGAAHLAWAVIASAALAAGLSAHAFAQQSRTGRERDGLAGDVYAVREYPESQQRTGGPYQQHTTSYYDKNGNLILKLEYAGGRMVVRRSFKHTSPEEVVEKIEDGGFDPGVDVVGPNPPPIQVIKHLLKFDSSGNVKEESLVAENGTVLKKTAYKRDSRGRVIEKSVEGKEPREAKGKSTFTYSGDGAEPVSSRPAFDHGSIPYTYSYQYDTHHNWTMREQLGGGGSIERTITYYSPDTGVGAAIAGESPDDHLQPAPLSALPRLIRRSAGALRGYAIRTQEPIYPAMARASHITGTVVVEVVVDHEGNVKEAHAISGPQQLRDAAVQAAKQWTFKPMTLGGFRVDVIGTLEFNFMQ